MIKSLKENHVVKCFIEKKMKCSKREALLE